MNVWKNILGYGSLKLRLERYVISKVHKNCIYFSHERYEKKILEKISERGISDNYHVSSNHLLLNFTGVFLYIFPSYSLINVLNIYFVEVKLYRNFQIQFIFFFPLCKSLAKSKKNIILYQGLDIGGWGLFSFMFSYVETIANYFFKKL